MNNNGHTFRPFRGIAAADEPIDDDYNTFVDGETIQRFRRDPVQQVCPVYDPFLTRVRATKLYTTDRFLTVENRDEHPDSTVGTFR